MVFGPKTANINCKKRQSLLNTVVIGHQRNKTANIKWGGEDEKGSQWKDPIANEADNTIVKSYDMTTKYKHLSHFHSLMNKACQNVFISPTQKIFIT